MTTRISENLKVKLSAKQTAATHSHPTSEDQAHITPSEQCYPTDDEPVPSASDQKTTGPELSYANTVTKDHSKLNRNTQGSAKPK